jgi:hypothetical protein
MEWSGYSASTAGDVNGDGLDDLIVGAFQANLNGTCIRSTNNQIIQAITVDIACSGN